MALPFAVGCGVAAGIMVPVLVGSGDPTGGLLAGQVLRLPVAGDLALSFSWATFGVVTMAVWALLAAARAR